MPPPELVPLCFQKPRQGSSPLNDEVRSRSEEVRGELQVPLVTGASPWAVRMCCGGWGAAQFLDQPSPQGPFAMDCVGFGNHLSINCVQAKHNIMTKNGSIQFKQTYSTEPIIRNEVIQSRKKSNDLEKKPLR